MRVLPIVLLCACLSLPMLGCGSSGSAGTGRSGASGTSGATATAGATGTSAPGTSTAARKPSPGGLKVITTPKFASPGNSPVQHGLVDVAYRNITINPGTLRVKAGTTVRWSNFDAVEHNVTSVNGPQQIASKNFGQGKSYSVTLTRPGTIHYECTIHPVSMNGTIEVLR